VQILYAWQKRDIQIFVFTDKEMNAVTLSDVSNVTIPLEEFFSYGFR